MIKYFVLIINLLFCTTAFSQHQNVSDNDSISYIKNAYVRNSEIIKISKFYTLIKQYPEAVNEFNIARGNYIGAVVLGTVGGSCLGYSLGTVMGGGEFNVLMAGGGLTAILLAIPLNSAANRHFKKAAIIYNREKSSGRPVSLRNPSDLKVTAGTTEYGLGIRVCF